MRRTALRMAATCASTLLIMPLAASAADAIAPLPVDDALLPKPGAPSPSRPTEQRDQCLMATRSSDDVANATQLNSLDLQSVWKLTRGAGQTVAVIDTGVSRHRLLPHLVAGGDYVSRSDGTDDCDGHGTMVAGIIGAAADPNGFSGVAPDATIISIRQSSNKFRARDDPSVSGFGDVDTLARAVRTAADMGATVINVSSVACQPADSGLDDRALGAALAYAVDVKNVVVVAAAGNVGGPGQCPDQNPAADPAKPGQPNWDNVKVVVSPAWYDDYVLTVGSVDEHGVTSEFSLAGPWVDIAAPGERVVSLDPDGEGLATRVPTFDGGAAPIAGTSYAAPVVSGIVALVRSRSPGLTARQVMQRLEETARQPPAGWDPAVGHGLVDPLAAVSGDAAAPPAVANIPRPVSPPPDIHADTRARTVAVWGAMTCLAVSVATIAMTILAARLRRTRETVPHD